MDFALIKPVLLKTVADLLGPRFSVDQEVVWHDKPRPFVSPDTFALVMLTVTNVAELGTDEERSRFDESAPNGKQIEFSQNGHRIFRLQIRCTSYDQDDGKTAFEYLESLRTRIRRRSALAALRAVNVAFVRAEATVPLTTVHDQRAVSDANLDLVMAAAVCEVDPERETWIENVGVEGSYL